MKRHPSLVVLSDDHHRALVLARRLKRSTAVAEDLASLESEVRRAFEAELEPHFLVEERWLVPPLERAGAAQLAGRLRDDHARVRQLVQRSPWTWEVVAELGALLERHVRFEERILFPEAESLLSDAELDAVKEASLGSARR